MEALGFFIGVSVLLVVILFVLKRSTTSLSYRKYLTNMYVAAKIRFLATEDGLSLDQEEKRFTEFISQSNKERITCLDDKIELELMDRVSKVKGVEEVKKGNK